MKWYPLKFLPILKEMIWGGTMLADIYGKKTLSPRIGESWELSTVSGSISVIANGECAGMPLDKLIAKNSQQILGKRAAEYAEGRFPLLIKFIDACDNLSVQVHPNDEQAKPYGSLGKTEMWYVLHAKPNASLISGLCKPLTEEEYLLRVKNGTLSEILQKHPVAAGDVFFIPAGRIHAIGSGIVLLEIQQSSDITYRIFDYNRRDAHGKQRELHTEQARQVINYNDCGNTKSTIERKKNSPFCICECPYFKANVIDMDANTTIERDYGAEESFAVLTCTKGSALIRYSDDETITLSMGETTLIPAAIERISLIVNDCTEIVEVMG